MNVFPRWDVEIQKQHEALENGHSNDIGQFIEWLGASGYEIGEWTDVDRIEPRIMPLSRNGGLIIGLLEEYFEIDPTLSKTSGGCCSNTFGVGRTLTEWFGKLNAG
jgi:hypothetical protein